MATKIVTKNSSTGGSAPSASDLVQGELAVNVTDKRLYTENNAGAIVELGTNPSTIDINAGTIDGTVIGGATAAAGTFTTLTANAASTITTADNTDTLSLISTDADASAGPNLRLYRNSASPADSDVLGVLEFEGRNDNSQDVVYSTIRVKAADVSDGSEDTSFAIQTIVGGSNRNRLNIDATETIINQDSRDLDFRVESDGNANALFVEGSSGNVGIGVAPSAWTYFNPIQAGRSSFAGSAGQTGVGYNWYFDGAYKYIASDYALAYQQNATSGVHSWSTAASGTAGATATLTQRMAIDSSGNLLVGTSTAGTKTGDGVIAFGSAGGVMNNFSASVANNGTLDIAINTPGGGYQGFLSVANTVAANAASRTQSTFSVFGRSTDSTIQQIHTDTGSTSAATFTVTTPSNGVIRVTNTSGSTTVVSMQFFGGTSG